MNFCRYCGSKLEEHAKFCTNCGKSIEVNDNINSTQWNINISNHSPLLHDMLNPNKYV